VCALPAFETALEPPAGAQAAERLASYLDRLPATARPRAGIARWISPTGDPAPPLPAALTLQENLNDRVKRLA
jgi:hypothetical protein